MYEYYLPILVRILKQYDALQTAQTDPNYQETKEKLGKTVVLINDANEEYGLQVTQTKTLLIYLLIWLH